MLSSKFLLVTRLFGVIVLAALLSLSSGCSGKAKYAPVSGKVTINGRPLTSGYVNFRPDKSKGNEFGGEAVGEINSQGEYTLKTRGQPGAPLGAYKVTVSAGSAITEDNTRPNTGPLINPTYMSADITPLEKTVVAQPAPGAYDLQLSP
jgi:hypothetical protein